ncbi:MAG: hypothetical protein U0L84_06610 [Acutalibacteraceae bacterium]|nr:hypothetical protein [Acutalibacteraceae bacterium]
MKKCFTVGSKMLLKLLVVVVLDFFLCISISVLCIGGFTENIGYDAYGYVNEGDESEYLYTYHTADGDDTKKAEYEAKGYTVVTNSIRSELSGKGQAVYLAVTQIFCILILAAFVYSPVYELGFKESNLVRFKHAEQDLLRGLKIGIIADGFFILTYIGLIIAKFAAPDMPISIYKLVNSYAYSIIEVIGGNAKVGELSLIKVALLALPLLIVPAIATVGYILGYKGISISEKLIYKKTKEEKVKK